MTVEQPMTQVPTFCPLCVSRCGAKATITGDEFVALRPDPSHPTGQALCVKGKAAPELVRHPERLLHPLKRTNPKGSDDPGWQRITWEEALDTVAARLSALAREHGPESVVFGSASPSTSAMSDSVDWVQRPQRAFGSPNLCAYMSLRARSRFTSARPSTVASPACAAQHPTRRLSCIPTRRDSAASPPATGCTWQPRTAASAPAPS